MRGFLDAETLGHYMVICKRYEEYCNKMACAAANSGMNHEAESYYMQASNARTMLQKLERNEVTLDDTHEIDRWDEVMTEIHPK